jgi:hypothetical protein
MFNKFMRLLCAYIKYVIRGGIGDPLCSSSSLSEEGEINNRRGEAIPPCHVTCQARRPALSSVILASGASNVEACSCVSGTVSVLLLFVRFCVCVVIAHIWHLEQRATRSWGR